ncbi:MAG TPA: rhomboid family intramembrane serine protease [Ohtaekwangia sp.]|nr:rhomboid family intramembrane serine protease [Ohtaekwangia sp.]
MLRLTPVVKNIIIINVLFFVGQALAPQVNFSDCNGRSMDAITGFLSMWNVRTDCFKPYQLFTYMFVHGGFMHIFFNMLALAFMGPILESFWGQKRFTLFYLVTGIGAGVFNIAVDLLFGVGSFGIMLGASGAVYGILMGFGMVFPNMEVQLLIPPIPIKAKYLVLVLGGLNFMMDRSGEVAHFAHLGGVIFAFILIRLWKHQGGGGYN